MKIEKQIKLYNIRYKVGKEEVEDSPYHQDNDLTYNQKVDLIKHELSENLYYKIDEEYGEQSSKQLIFNEAYIFSKIEKLLAQLISDNVCHHAESFDFTIEDVKQDENNIIDSIASLKQSVQSSIETESQVS